MDCPGFRGERARFRRGDPDRSRQAGAGSLRAYRSSLPTQTISGGKDCPGRAGARQCSMLLIQKERAVLPRLRHRSQKTPQADSVRSEGEAQVDGWQLPQSRGRREGRCRRRQTEGEGHPGSDAATPTYSPSAPPASGRPPDDRRLARGAAGLRDPGRCRDSDGRGSPEIRACDFPLGGGAVSYATRPGNRCPQCGHQIDRCTPLGTRAPQPGDVSVCAYCGEMLVFRGTGAASAAARAGRISIATGNQPQPVDHHSTHGARRAARVCKELMNETQETLFPQDLQSVMDRRHDLFRRAVLGGQEVLLPSSRQANRDYCDLRARERHSPEWREKQLPHQKLLNPSRL